MTVAHPAIEQSTVVIAHGVATRVNTTAPAEDDTGAVSRRVHSPIIRRNKYVLSREYLQVTPLPHSPPRKGKYILILVTGKHILISVGNAVQPCKNLGARTV